MLLLAPILLSLLLLWTAVSTVDLTKVSAIDPVPPATLVHDDILIRHLYAGASTIHTEIGNHSSILLGDALFSYAPVSHESLRLICRIVSKRQGNPVLEKFGKPSREISSDLDDTLRLSKTKLVNYFASCEVGSQIAIR